jgi:hypothetical protein
MAGVVGLAGCVVRAPMGRRLYPEYPSPEDALAADPCSVKKTPDVVLRNAPFELLGPLQENLRFLRKVNPVFVCGLERIEVLGDAEYKESADPKYTRRSVGLYTPADRVVRLKASAGITLTHEVGHHIHNLGYFAPTIREFMAQGWMFDESGRRIHRCEGDDCFLNEAAASEPVEDWARTFEMVLMRPVETAAAVNFSLSETGETPLQKKVSLIRSISSLPEPVKGEVHFGTARTLEDADIKGLEERDSATALPASLPPETVRRIFRAGKASLRPWAWDNRRYPFLAGNFVVFPVFKEEEVRLGFFAYDLAHDQFVALELKTEGLPEEFREAADSFTNLEVRTDQDGDLLLIGYRDAAAPLAAPLALVIDSN